MGVDFESKWGGNSSDAATSLTIVNVTTAGTDRIMVTGVGIKSTTTTLTDVVRGGTETSTEVDVETGATSLRLYINEYHNTPADDPAAAAADVVITISASRRLCGMIYSLSNANQTTPHGARTAANGTAESSSIAPASDSEDLVVDYLITVADATAHAAGAGQVNVIDAHDTVGDTTARIDGFGSTEPHTGGSSTTMSWSWTTSTDFVAIGMAIKESVVADLPPRLVQDQDIVRGRLPESSKVFALDATKLPADLAGAMVMG